MVDIQPLVQRFLDANDSQNVLNFERKWLDESYVPFVQWMQRNWSQSIIYAAIYVVLVFAGRRYMEKREKFDLRTPLAIWSSVLAVFSLAGTLRTVPELLLVLKQQGLHESICVPGYHNHPITSFWGAMFVLSKVWELGDTYFIVLRKQTLIFLHWYHHITVMIFSFHSYSFLNGAGRWFMNMNFLVHTFMYSYFALRAMRFRVPAYVNMIITAMQLAQMLMGVYINVYIYRALEAGLPCSVPEGALTAGFLMYASYAVLFAHFFYTTYMRPRSSAAGRVKED